MRPASYVYCACRDCMEITIGRAGVTFCDECLAAACDGDEQPSECNRAPELDLYQPPACPMCGGKNQTLGALGNVEHYRCRQCGMTSTQEPQDIRS